MKKVRSFNPPPSEDIARISLKLLLDGEATDEPTALVDQARAWLRENIGVSSSEETADS